MKTLFRTTALICIWLLSPLATAADRLPVTPYQARYEVYASGIAVGQAVITLIATGPESYQMRSEVRPNGLVALFASSRVDEQVSGAIHNGAIQPQQYERVLDAGRKSSRMHAQFDWAAGELIARYDADQATLPLTPGVLDPLSLQLAVMGDMQRGHLPSQYRLVDRTEIKTYLIRHQGEEVLETSLGRLRTERINQYTPGKTRMTTFWVAPELQYLPVRIMQEKRGKEEIRMDLRAVERSP